MEVRMGVLRIFGTSAKILKPFQYGFWEQEPEVYGKAKTLSAEVISGPYSLLPDWMNMWGKGPAFDNRYNNEFIWASQTASGLYGHGFADHYSDRKSVV